MAGAVPPKKNATVGQDPSLLYLKGRKSALDGDYEQALKYLEKAYALDSESLVILNQLSEVYLKLGDGSKAVEFGKKTVENAPKNVSYRLSLAGIYASLRQFGQAREQYEEALKLKPGDRKITLLLGIVEAEVGDIDKSIKIFTRAIKQNSDNEMAYFYRARIYLEKDDVKQAKRDLDKALSLRPSFKEAGLTLGMILEREGDVKAAIAVYKRIDGSGRYKKRLAQLYLQQKEYRKALKALLEYESLDESDYTVKVKIGLVYFELKEYENAVSKFQEILKKEPGSDNVRFYLAAVQEEAGQLNEAIKNYKKVSSESSFYAQAVLHVGFLLRKNKRLQEGVDFAKRVVKKSPEIPEFYDMYASFYEAKGNYKVAIKIIQRGLKRHKANEKLLYFEGALHDKLGNRKDSIKKMKQILEINPNNAHALNFLGYTYAEMGDNLEEAKNLIGRALKIRPNDGFIEDSMGWVLFKMGQVEEALKRLNRALKLQPKEAVIYDHLGDIYVFKKEYSKASEMYKKAITFSKGKDRKLNKKVSKKLTKLDSDKRSPTNSKK